MKSFAFLRVMFGVFEDEIHAGNEAFVQIEPSALVCYGTIAPICQSGVAGFADLQVNVVHRLGTIGDGANPLRVTVSRHDVSRSSLLLLLWLACVHCASKHVDVPVVDASRHRLCSEAMI
jgi:hypothetical protein